jgi:hypothetical protein
MFAPLSSRFAINALRLLGLDPGFAEIVTGISQPSGGLRTTAFLATASG